MKIRFFPLLPLALGLAAGGLAGCHRKPPPSIDGLTDALERSAEKEMPAPSLASEQVILPVRPGQTDAQVSEVLQEATAAGGAALRSTDASGRLSILATLPDNNADAFKAALRHEPSLMHPPSTTTCLIEILFQPPNASPTP